MADRVALNTQIYPRGNLTKAVLEALKIPKNVNDFYNNAPMQI